MHFQVLRDFSYMAVLITVIPNNPSVFVSAYVCWLTCSRFSLSFSVGCSAIPDFFHSLFLVNILKKAPVPAATPNRISSRIGL